MKLGRTTLNNTDRALLDVLATSRGCFPVPALVRMFYPQTKQLDKKVKTFTKYLRRLQRFGRAREVQGGWTIDGDRPVTPLYPPRPSRPSPPTLRLSA